jgi:hypothetical protein
MAKAIPLNRLRDISKQRPIRRSTAADRIEEEIEEPAGTVEWPISR